MSTIAETRRRTTRLRSEELMEVARRAAAPMATTLVATTVVSVAVGLLVVGPLAGPAGRWDLWVVEHLAADRTAAVDRLTGFGAFLADTLPVAVLWIGAMALGAWLTGHWVVPVFLLFVIGGEKLAYLATSVAVGRARPPVETLGQVFATNSFPSGHVGSAVTLYGSIAVAVIWHRAGIGRPLPSWSIGLSAAAVLAIAALVAFSRTYRAHHYPSDVIWGALLGVAWLVAGWRSVLGSSSAPWRRTPRDQREGNHE